jgi:hypothetical protein
VNGVLCTATIVTSLALAAWYLVLAVLDRAPGRAALGAMAGLAALVLVLVVTALVWLFTGDREGDPFILIGYLITTVALPPTGFQLARMEPTRWGSVILTVACLTMPVLVLRLQQLAGALT